MAVKLLIAAAAAALAAATAALRDGDHAHLVGPFGMDPTLDCGMRGLALNYSAALGLTPAQQGAVFDALRLGVDCNATFIAVPSHRAAAAVAAAAVSASPAWYVDPVGGSDGNSGSQSAPFASLGRAVLASRSLPPPTPRSILIVANATVYLPLGATAPGTIVLTDTDSGLTISSADATAPATVSGAVPLPPLTWQPFNTTTAVAAPTAGVTCLSGCVVGPQGSDPPVCLFAGLTVSADDCRAACAANATCVSGYTWHDASTGGFAQNCYFRGDGEYPVSQAAGHYSGSKVALDVWVADVSGVSGVEWSAVDTLVMNGRRQVRGRYPNANPELVQSPTGYDTASSWLAPTSYPPPQNIEIATHLSRIAFFSHRIACT